MGQHPRQRTKPILVVENPSAASPRVRRVLSELGIGDKLIRSATPQEALDCLRDGSVERPCIVLLGVDGPGTESLAPLQAIKQDERLKCIPVVVLGPTGDDRMVDESFGLGAAGYLARVPDHSRFSATIRSLYDYWALSELPR